MIPERPTQETPQVPPPASKLDFQRVLPIFTLVFVDVLGLTVILPLLHIYAITYGASPLEIGLVAAAFPLAQLFGVPFMGALSDRFGRKPLLLFSQVTTCISFVMLGLADSLFLIVLSRVIDGTFGANLATAQAALSDVTDDTTRAQGLGLTGAAFGLGFILGPVIALVTLEISDNNLAIPAFTAAVYSFISIFLTLFLFKETLPPEKRGKGLGLRTVGPMVTLRMLRAPQINIMLVLMFAQQLIFFAFESLMGLFTLSRLGLLGQGNAVIFVIVGAVLVTVQVRYIGPWSRKYGERKMVFAALGLLSIGLILVALTPEQAHPFYIQNKVMHQLAEQASVSSTEAVIGHINVDLPLDSSRGLGGILWMLVAVVPLSVGAALIRPSLNSLMTKRVGDKDYGSVLGVSASFVSAAQAIAPLLGGLLFQHYGSSAPFLLGGVVMGGLLLVSMGLIRPTERAQAQAA
jgi:DHA1 family tetracycline resistance protein-like MFS transporter